MSQTVSNFTFTSAQTAAIETALTMLETELASLQIVQPAAKRRMAQLGDKSEAFCRQALRVLAENPKVVPTTLDVPHATRALNTRDQLKTHAIRLARLLSRMDDTAFLLGSDAMNVATKGYSLLAVVGRAEGLGDFRKELGTRFAKTRRAANEEKNAA